MKKLLLLLTLIPILSFSQIGYININLIEKQTYGLGILMNEVNHYYGIDGGFDSGQKTHYSGRISPQDYKWHSQSINLLYGYRFDNWLLTTNIGYVQYDKVYGDPYAVLDLKTYLNVGVSVGLIINKLFLSGGYSTGNKLNLKIGIAL